MRLTKEERYKVKRGDQPDSYGEVVDWLRSAILDIENLESEKDAAVREAVAEMHNARDAANGLADQLTAAVERERAVGPCGKHPMACHRMVVTIPPGQTVPQGEDGDLYCTVCAELTAATERVKGHQIPMNDNQIKYMVNRFLMWRLPENFNPDAGISFKSHFNEHTTHPMKHEPVGTNLFDATQTEEMVRYLVDGLPASAPPAELLRGASKMDEQDLRNAAISIHMMIRDDLASGVPSEHVPDRAVVVLQVLILEARIEETKWSVTKAWREHLATLERQLADLKLMGCLTEEPK